MSYRDIYPESLTDGIGLISSLSLNPNVPWYNALKEDIESLEIAFNMAHGNKDLTETFKIISPQYRVKMLVTMFAEKWSKLWRAYSIEYNMLDAYVLNETGTNSKTNNRVESNDYGKTITEQGTNTGNVTTNTDTATSDTDTIYGFNSSSAVNANGSSGTEGVEETETRNLSDSRTTTHGGTDSRTNDDTEEGEYTITKNGNIGYSTPQDMIRAELELWGEPFFKQVFNDIVNFTMVTVY